MSQPSPGFPVSPGTLSPDGAYIWNGTKWIPNAPGPWIAPPPKKGHGLRNAGFGCLGCIGLLVIGIIALAALGNSLGGRTSGSNSPGTGCSPKPCANANGVTVSVSNLNRNAPLGGLFIPPEKGNHLVLMEMTMHNGSSAKQTAGPFNFKLRDAAGLEHDVTFSDAPGCVLWQPVDLTPGATLGPKPLCFQAFGDPNGRLTLLWSAGLFSATEEVPL